MTLQEKIDKFPLSIYYNGFDYDFNLFGRDEQVYIEYGCLDDEGEWIHLVLVCNSDNIPISQRLEDVVDRALTIIENKEWEK